jgi:hypothetical protein
LIIRLLGSRVALIRRISLRNLACLLWVSLLWLASPTLFGRLSQLQRVHADMPAEVEESVDGALDEVLLGRSITIEDLAESGPVCLRKLSNRLELLLEAAVISELSEPCVDLTLALGNIRLNMGR